MIDSAPARLGSHPTDLILREHYNTRGKEVRTAGAPLEL